MKRKDTARSSLSSANVERYSRNHRGCTSSINKRFLSMMGNVRSRLPSRMFFPLSPRVLIHEFALESCFS